MMKKVFLNIALVVIGLFSCQNDKPAQLVKVSSESNTIKSYYEKYSDIIRYKCWFFNDSSLNINIGGSSSIDTLRNDNVLLGIIKDYRSVVVSIKNTKTQKFYSIFQLNGILCRCCHIDSINKNFRTESKDTKAKIQNICRNSLRQIKFFHYDILKLLELQMVNDTLKLGVIETLFDEIFYSLKNSRKSRYSAFWVDESDLLFKKDTNMTSFKMFLKTKRVKALYNYEEIAFWLKDVSPTYFLSYEIKKNTYLLIPKGVRKLHDMRIFVFGECVDYKINIEDKIF